MFKYLALLLTITVALPACTTVNHMPITPEAAAKLKNQSVVESRYEMPDFTAFTAGKAAFALIGAAAMISEGNEIVKTNNIEDPAIKISHELAKKLAASHNMTINANGDKATASDELPELVSAYPGSNYLLDVKTLGWMFNYYPTDWSHYRVTYNARLRLVDAASKDVVAESGCQSVQGDDNNPPTKDQLLENNAALLKKHLDNAATACVEVFSKEVLKL